MSKFDQYVGQVFGRITIISRDLTRNYGSPNCRPFMNCLCICGESKSITVYSLLRGTTTSCGCFHKEDLVQRNFKHGFTDRANPYRAIPKEYEVWQGMKKRCYNPRCQDYKDYGGRGIRVCDEWRNDFQAFFDHVGPAPSPQHSIDRIRVHESYKPGNVKWSTPIEQANNKRRNAPKLVIRRKVHHEIHHVSED